MFSDHLAVDSLHGIYIGKIVCMLDEFILGIICSAVRQLMLSLLWSALLLRLLVVVVFVAF